MTEPRAWTAKDQEQYEKEQETKRRQEIARRNEEMIKRQARSTWLEQGGSPDEFDSVWDKDLRGQFSEEIRRAEVRALAESDRAAREAYRRSPANKL